jgi:hypothetical protein
MSLFEYVDMSGAVNKVTAGELKQLAATGAITTKTHVRKVGSQAWSLAHNVKGLVFGQAAETDSFESVIVNLNAENEESLPSLDSSPVHAAPWTQTPKKPSVTPQQRAWTRSMVGNAILEVSFAAIGILILSSIGPLAIALSYRDATTLQIVVVCVSLFWSSLMPLFFASVCGFMKTYALTRSKE